MSPDPDTKRDFKEGRARSPRREGLYNLVDAIATAPRTEVVYFMQIRDDGPIKIGFSKGRPLQRLKLISANHPYEVRMLRVEPGDREDETTLHRIFAAHALKHEWFESVPELVELANPETPLPEWWGKTWLRRDVAA